MIIKVDNYSFVCPDKKMSLLEAIESENIEAEYQCRQGFCGMCRVRLCEGKVSYFEEPIAFIPEEYILPCCCRAEGDVTIEYEKNQKTRQIKNIHESQSIHHPPDSHPV